MVGGLAALGNGVGRVFWGKMADKVDFFKGYATTTLLQILLLLLLPLAASSRLAFSSAVCATIFCLGGNISMFASVNAKFFGVCNAGEIYSVLFSAFALAVIGGSQLTKSLLVKIGWSGIFRLMAAMCGAAALGAGVAEKGNQNAGSMGTLPRSIHGTRVVTIVSSFCDLGFSVSYVIMFARVLLGAGATSQMERVSMLGLGKKKKSWLLPIPRSYCMHRLLFMMRTLNTL
jgi:hypothetical protein